MIRRIMLFISSYIPLYILLVIKNVLERCTDEGRITFTVCQLFTAHYFDEVNDYAIVILSVFCIVSWCYLKRITKKTGNLHYYKVIEISNETGNVFFSYISLYLFSCMGLSLNNIVDIFILLFLMVLVGFVYINNQMMYMNPVLQFMGYKIYECMLFSLSTEETFSTIAIAKRDVLIEQNQEYAGSGKQDFVLFDKEVKHHELSSHT